MVEGVTHASATLAGLTFLAAMLRGMILPSSGPPPLLQTVIVSGMVGICGLIALIGAALLLKLENKSAFSELGATQQSDMNPRAHSVQIRFALLLAILMVGFALIAFARSLATLFGGSHP